jgi:hypothetical protein
MAESKGKPTLSVKSESWPTVLRIASSDEFQQSLAVAQLALQLCERQWAQSTIPLQKHNLDPKAFLAAAWIPKFFALLGNHQSGELFIIMIRLAAKSTRNSPPKGWPTEKRKPRSLQAEIAQPVEVRHDQNTSRGALSGTVWLGLSRLLNRQDCSGVLRESPE